MRFGSKHHFATILFGHQVSIPTALEAEFRLIAGRAFPEFQVEVAIAEKLGGGEAFHPPPAGAQRILYGCQKIRIRQRKGLRKISETSDYE